MGKRQKLWASKARARLKKLLGGRCKGCGAYGFELGEGQQLEFDCIKPCGHGHHRMESSSRMSFYHKQWSLGNVQLLCTKCNTEKSIKEYEDYKNNS